MLSPEIGRFVPIDVVNRATGFPKCLHLLLTPKDIPRELVLSNSFRPLSLVKARSDSRGYQPNSNLTDDLRVPRKRLQPCYAVSGITLEGRYRHHPSRWTGASMGACQSYMNIKSPETTPEIPVPQRIIDSLELHNTTCLTIRSMRSL